MSAPPCQSPKAFRIAKITQMIATTSMILGNGAGSGITDVNNQTIKPASAIVISSEIILTFSTVMVFVANSTYKSSGSRI